MNMSSKIYKTITMLLKFHYKAYVLCKLPFVHQFDKRSYKGDILNLPTMLSIAQAGKSAADGGRH